MYSILHILLQVQTKMDCLCCAFLHSIIKAASYSRWLFSAVVPVSIYHLLPPN